MQNNRKIGRWIGILYIIGTVSGILSLVFTGALQSPEYLTASTENKNSIVFGTLLILLMGLSLAMMAVIAFPVFRKHNQTLAVSFVVFRSGLEAVTYMASILNMLLILSVSESFIQAGAGQMDTLITVGGLLRGADVWINEIRVLIFGISALIVNTILFRSRLVPRWISIWGFIGAGLHLVNGLLTMFGIVESMSTLATLIDMPIALQEMVFAVFLLIKGFSIPSSQENK